MTSELIDRPLLSYLCQLNDDMVKRLYQSEVCCVAIYRILPPVSQQCIAMMTFNSKFRVLKHCSAESSSAIKDNLNLLRRLRIIEDDDGDYILNMDFRFNYLRTTVKGVIRTADIAIVKDFTDKVQKSAGTDLYKKAVERWECVLSYLALPSETSIQNVSIITRELFQHIGFNRSVGNEFEITSRGFQFLLLGRTEQIWTYLVYYFQYIEATQSEEDLFRSLEFFFRLALCVTPDDLVDHSAEDENRPKGRSSTPYINNPNWSGTIQKFLTHLRELGLVFMRKWKYGHFFLTPIFAMTIAGDNLSLKDMTVDVVRDKGFLVTETNCRISAYSNSNLHLSILSTFTKILLRFDAFVVAHMTRETVQEAFQVGITARQITQFLRSNAHRKTIDAHGPLHCVPPTVIDQIHLWESERERLATQECVMYSVFNSEQEYLNLRNFAMEKNILLYDDNRQKIIVVTNDGHEQVREWRTQR